MGGGPGAVGVGRPVVAVVVVVLGRWYVVALCDVYGWVVIGCHCGGMVVLGCWVLGLVDLLGGWWVGVVGWVLLMVLVEIGVGSVIVRGWPLLRVDGGNQVTCRLWVGDRTAIDAAERGQAVTRTIIAAVADEGQTLTICVDGSSADARTDIYCHTGAAVDADQNSRQRQKRWRSRRAEVVV